MSRSWSNRCKTTSFAGHAEHQAGSEREGSGRERGREVPGDEQARVEAAQLRAQVQGLRAMRGHSDPRDHRPSERPVRQLRARGLEVQVRLFLLRPINAVALHASPASSRQRSSLQQSARPLQVPTGLLREKEGKL
ncbi:uncharacterized protein LOC104436460 isoform X1 [Eucalyptus grandis]|uniref:uncharacterized protein LOC104436460 isoform X1 n=1 Tax=Eucalyptus grandis TaxID=71139 RepID=UPI00192ED9F7|nr:uncharacterized protein LOC104436460 isoform X1 [Eucalyptus grandis]